MPERAIDYQSINQKKDRGFQLEAPSLERLYIDSALAMTDQLVKLNLIQGSNRFEISVESNSRETLLTLWLNEVLNLFEKNKFLPKQIYFTRFNGSKIQATLIGEIYNPIKHGHVTKLNPVELNQLQLGSLSQSNNGFFVRVFLNG
ncbi:archease [bacterium]|nr:archease [bacterium]